MGSAARAPLASPVSAPDLAAEARQVHHPLAAGSAADTGAAHDERLVAGAAGGQEVVVENRQGGEAIVRYGPINRRTSPRPHPVLCGDLLVRRAPYQHDKIAVHKRELHPSRASPKPSGSHRAATSKVGSVTNLSRDKGQPAKLNYAPGTARRPHLRGYLKSTRISIIRALLPRCRATLRSRGKGRSRPIWARFFAYAAAFQSGG